MPDLSNRQAGRYPGRSHSAKRESRDARPDEPHAAPLHQMVFDDEKRLVGCGSRAFRLTGLDNRVAKKISRDHFALLEVAGSRDSSASPMAAFRLARRQVSST